ncbi:MAG: pyridoxal-phosphate-dependent aminotransferase family protein [Candidatus Dormibacteraceae bacterium]
MEDTARLLLIPGPVSVGDDVLEALGRPVPAHYGEAWAPFYADVQRRLRAIACTSGTVYPLFGPGTAGIEMALGSVLQRGDEILVGSNGYFGGRLAAVARGLGLLPHIVESAPRTPLTPEELTRALDEHPASRLFAVVHDETSLGLLNPIQDLCPLAHARGLLTLVDAVASFGGVRLDMDLWNVDLAVGTINKALAAPVGFAIVAAGEGAWAAVDDGREKAAGWYLNLATWRAAAAEDPMHPTPSTVASNVFEALGAALDRIDREGGIEAHRELSARAAERVRSGMRELGFEPVMSGAAAAPVLTAFWVPEGLPYADFAAYLRERHGIRIGGGLEPYQGRMFRIGHMGRAAEPEVTDRFLHAVADYLDEKGLRPNPAAASLANRAE